MGQFLTVADLPDGFYYVVDTRCPGEEGIIHRLAGTTWRMGEHAPFADSYWDEAVSFFPVPRLADKAGKTVGIVTFKEQLFVATENGVYVKGEDDVFRPLQFSQEPLK